VNSEVRLTRRGAYADIFELLAHYHRTNVKANPERTRSKPDDEEEDMCW
jgi:hypothetical protein